MIKTKYHGATNKLGSRISVTTICGSNMRRYYYSWDDSLDLKENHIAAFKKFVVDNNLVGEYIEYIGVSTDNGYLFTKYPFIVS